MKQCPTCATELPDDARFCGACGYNYAAAPPPTPPLAAPPAAAPPTPPSSPKAEAGDAFELRAEDFGRAFVRVAELHDVVLPATLPHDHKSLFEAAEAAGLDKLELEKALHRVSIEKLPEDQRRALGIVLEEDIEARGRSPWIPLVVVVNVIAAVVVVLVLVLRDDTPVRPPVELKPQQGQIDEAALGPALDAFATAAKACYDAALKNKADLQGDVVITLRIDLEGKAQDPTLSKDELGDEAARACILAAAAAQAYPAATVAPVDVDVPLSFAPGG